ncbi:hypothetical protein [Nocardia wallacei]|uniref:Anti-sigma-M factor RsmA n=1 Tax=Nocardia wallacei TaxID=480035 RepID=A0A7G1KXL4_9NOCA|nr:hypothetical protein [Nocardia wallacei]BCK59376.1 hypothetical protein NWFMUON74_71480 [Nocardia wallacei]
MAARPAPQPPFSTDLLADLHADNVSPELSEQLWPQVREDPESLRFLRSLDDVTAELQALGQDSRILHEMPPEVTARLDRLLDDLSRGEHPGESAPAEQLATVHPLPPRRISAESTDPPSTRPMPALSAEAAAAQDEPAAEPIRLDTPRSRRWQWLTAVAAAVAVLAGTLIAIDAVRGPGQAPKALPTEQTAVPLDDDLPTATLVSAIGRNDVTGPLAAPGAMAGCIAAAGYERPVLGSMNVTFRGAPAVVIILTGPQPPEITALVVGTGCGPGDAQLLDQRDIG